MVLAIHIRLLIEVRLICTGSPVDPEVRISLSGICVFGTLPQKSFSPAS